MQNLSEFLQSETFPFHQSDYPNPYPLYWFRDHNQNLVIYLPVGIKPFLQSDWPLPGVAPPLDTSWYINLSNLPAPPVPPPIITDIGSKTWTKEEWTKKLTEYTRSHLNASAVHLGRLGGIASGKARRK